jgi:predicted RecB family nuclease
VGARITGDIIESYLTCKLKAHLKLAGNQGIRSDYEGFLLQTRREVRQQAIGKILSKTSRDDVASNIPLTAASLRAGSSYVLDTILEDDLLSVSFDGLKKVDGPSGLGDFHYVPMLFHEANAVGKAQRLLLELLGWILSRSQGRLPAYGIVWHGRECKVTKVRLNPDTQRSERLLRELKEMASPGLPPSLILNNHCPVCEFRQRCHDQAVQEDNISLLRGIGDKEIRKLNRKGIFTIAQLSCIFRLRKRGKRVKRQNQPHYFALQASAIRDKKIYVLKPPPIPSSPVRIYLDIEGNSERTFVYLLGMIVDDRGNETRYSLWADRPEEEELIFQQMLEIISRYEDFRLIHFGSYEAAFFRRMKKTFTGHPTLTKLTERSINILPTIYSHIYFPLHSNGLKAIGSYLGCTWSDPDASGLKSIILRSKWETLHDENLKQELVRYNLEDCMALKRVAELVYKIGEGLTEEKSQPEIALEGHVIGRAEDINTVSSRQKYGKSSFVIPDFEHINSCAYFDYQREKVFLRAGGSVRKARSRRKERRRRVRVNRTITVRSNKCPLCGGSEIVRAAGPAHTKLAYDLKLTESGINRQVIACTCVLHQCNECQKRFLPSRYKRRAKHFHNLKSWAMYQHVAHRISFKRLQEIFSECFGLHVHYEEIHNFKQIMALYYQKTYKQILSNLLTGNLIHADETNVNFQIGKGYIWVLANMKNVVYVYRPNRDGDWLQELLSGFTGVLVSDFFSAYDSIPCEQQKCLVHLIRDMNHDLLCSPYDQEYKSLVSQFGVLLRGIIDTIDRYGLRRFHLHKHEVDVDRFYLKLNGQSFKSELASEYWQRLVKYREKLFLFLRHDNVPWNNNNAEHAFRPFANYRNTSDGMMTDTGLRDYLVLLSIYQTCKYRGISFLRFLVSQERDLNGFHDSGRMRTPKLSLQVYAEGFSSFARNQESKTSQIIYPNG